MNKYDSPAISERIEQRKKVRRNIVRTSSSIAALAVSAPSIYHTAENGVLPYNPSEINTERIEHYENLLEDIYTDTVEFDETTPEPEQILLARKLGGSALWLGIGAPSITETDVKDILEPSSERAEIETIPKSLADATGIEHITLTDALPMGAHGKMVDGMYNPFTPETFYVNVTNIRDHGPNEVRRMIVHESMHGLATKRHGWIPLLAGTHPSVTGAYPEFTAADPAGWEYTGYAHDTGNQDIAYREAAATSKYGSANSTESVAVFGEQIFAPVGMATAFDLESGEVLELDKKLEKNAERPDSEHFTLAKTAIMLAMMEEVNPKLAEDALYYLQARETRRDMFYEFNHNYDTDPMIPR